jgi:predicted HTH domain antitoxin
MNISTTIEIPEEVMFSLRENEKDMVKEMKRISALKYYIEKKLSLGQCSLLAEMSKEEFISYISSQKVSIFSLTKEELFKDIENA